MSAQTTPGGNLYFTTAAEITQPSADQQRAINRDARDRELQQVAKDAVTKAEKAGGTLGQVKATADQAATSARSAWEANTALIPRIENVETIAGLAPGDVSDATMASVAQNPKTMFSRELSSAISGRIALPPMPLRSVSKAPRGTSPVPIRFFNGLLWGSVGNIIYRSSDEGTSWEEHASIPAEYGTNTQAVSSILPCHDGEVLVFTTTHVARSTGWGSSNTTWTTVLENPTASYFYPWSIDGDGQKFVVTHYSGSGTATPDRADSQYGWISIDGGHTFELKWDTAVLFSPSLNERSHIHAAAYDPWEDRFFISEGHEEATGVYVSYDDGDSWSLIPYDEISPGNSPTTITPTDHGVVFGTDAPPNGVLVLPRGETHIKSAWVWGGMQNSQLLGYAHMAYRDPQTGMVYLVYELNPAAGASGFTAPIAASDGRVAGPVWEAGPEERLWRRVVVTDNGQLIAYEQSTNTILKGYTSGVGLTDPRMSDTGRILGGSAIGQDGVVAVGAEAQARGNRAIAIGRSSTNGNDGIAIGAATVAGSGIAIGLDAVADIAGLACGTQSYTLNGLAVGFQARSRHAGSTAVGRGSRALTITDQSAPNATAIGRDAKAQAAGGNTLAAGYNANASGTRSTAVGSSSSASTTDAVALGERAEATTNLGATALGARSVASHNNSVALGVGASTTGNDQVNIGEKHIEGEAFDVDPVAPAAGNWRLFGRINTSGKTELCVRFNSGVVKVLAVED